MPPTLGGIFRSRLPRSFDFAAWIPPRVELDGVADRPAISRRFSTSLAKSRHTLRHTFPPSVGRARRPSRSQARHGASSWRHRRAAGRSARPSRASEGTPGTRAASRLRDAGRGRAVRRPRSRTVGARPRSLTSTLPPARCGDTRRQSGWRLRRTTAAPRPFECRCPLARQAAAERHAVPQVLRGGTSASAPSHEHTAALSASVGDAWSRPYSSLTRH